MSGDDLPMKSFEIILNVQDVVIVSSTHCSSSDNNYYLHIGTHTHNFATMIYDMRGAFFKSFLIGGSNSS